MILNIVIYDIKENKAMEMSFSKAMSTFGLSYENAKYYAQTNQIFDGRYYLEGIGGDPIPPDDYWTRR